MYFHPVQPMHGNMKMRRLAFATAVATVALAAAGVAPAVHAADLMVSTPPPAAPMAPASPMNVYAMLYGGVAFGGAIDWYNPDGSFEDEYTIDPGWAIGGTIGVETPIDGVSIEGDIFHTYREYNDYPTYNLSTTSLMANLKYTAHLSSTFDVYMGAGLGGIMLSYDDDGDIYEGWGLGYQAMVGASMNVTDNVSIFGELRYQNSFSPIPVSGPYDDYQLQAPVAAALVGIKLSM